MPIWAKLHFQFLPTHFNFLLEIHEDQKCTEVGSTFEEISKIIEGVNLKEKVGVCMDTCHIHEAGYDIVNDLDGVLKEFDEVIGLDKLYAIHLNDSKNKIGAKKDRHEKIGEGKGHKREIELLKNLRK